jgi:Domain of unknown function (DUF4145)
MQKYYPPQFKEEKFHCPHCHVYSRQTWDRLYYSTFGDYPLIKDMYMCTCIHCDKNSYWYQGKLIIPDLTTATPPHTDLPQEVLEDYVEAASILSKSPRGAAALLRLALQKLMKELGESGKDINKDIGSLVSKGLPPQVQQALDIVRVIGNESVHPGNLDLKDDVETATQLFGLINFIVEDRIARPKAIQSLFDSLPEGKKKGIETRDTVKTP